MTTWAEFCRENDIGRTGDEERKLLDKIFKDEDEGMGRKTAKMMEDTIKRLIAE